MAHELKDCPWPFSRLYVHVNGDVMPCCYSTFPIANVNDGADLAAVWEGDEMNAVRDALLANKVHRVCAGAGCAWVASAIPDETLRDYAQITWAIPQGFVPEHTRRLAMLGQRDALFAVGAAHLSDGDPDAAMRWLEEAARRGSELAHYRLGLVLLEAGGAIITPEGAAQFEKSSDLGYGPASVQLGRYYSESASPLYDFNRAQALFKKGAAQGDPMGWLQLAWLYVSGNDESDQNMDEALRLVALAARHGVAGAAEVREHINAMRQKAAHRDALASFIPANADFDLTHAVSLLTTASDAGYGPASVRLGRCYHMGEGVARDLVKARTLFETGAEQGDPAGWLLLASFHACGEGVAQDFDEARRLTALAERRGAAGIAESRALIDQEVTKAARNALWHRRAGRWAKRLFKG